MDNFSILIGGKAGFGIDKAGSIIGRALNQLGYRIYIYRDYPSIIRGGHTFSVIRISKKRIATHRLNIDLMLALNQDTFDLHKNKLNKQAIIIHDSNSVKLEGISSDILTIGIPFDAIIKEEGVGEIMRNTCIIAAFAKAAGIEWSILENVLKKEITKELELNLKVARRGYDQAKELIKIDSQSTPGLPMITGNQAIGLGLVKAGLKTYIAYPMTPSSPILHFLAEQAQDFGLKVIHPESEISVMLMALGFAYAGEKVAVGTSGGGFCLMTEGVSLSGMAELPAVIIVGQRPGPSTGLPTYSSQTELFFVLFAGQGEFPRFIVAPGDAEESYYWSAIAMNMAWKYQIPAFILSDKNLGEGVFNFDIDSVGEIKVEKPLAGDNKSPYKRYLNTPDGVSPLAFVPQQGAVIKANSYEHDELGITTEDPQLTKLMQEKRLRKEKLMVQDLDNYKTVNVSGHLDASTAVLCWGSNKGVCAEAADNLGLKVVQPVVLWPFPLKQLKESLSGVKKIICVENNATGQLAKLMADHGFTIDKKILRYDGRPFTPDELETALKEADNG